MFGLGFSLGGQLIQGSVQRTWSCVNKISDIIRQKYDNNKGSIMPKQRRRHQSRSRSHSHDKDRDVKRRKLENYDSPNHKRSVSLSKDDAAGADDVIVLDSPSNTSPAKLETSERKSIRKSGTLDGFLSFPKKNREENKIVEESPVTKKETATKPIEEVKPKKRITPIRIDESTSQIDKTDESDVKVMENNVSSTCTDDNEVAEPDASTPKKLPTAQMKEEKTPIRRMTPKQLEKKLESEKRREQKEKEKAERERLKQEEKDRKEAEKQRKQKEIEQKKREKEEQEEQKRLEKEQKRLEKEKKEEQKRKEKEEEKRKKQQEADEKNREKRKEEEKKQKAAAAFASFFVAKKVNSVIDEKKPETTLLFMPFEVKSDMKLPPPRRNPLSDQEKQTLSNYLEASNNPSTFLNDIKTTKSRSCSKTWPCELDDDDVLILEDEEILGETICEARPKKTMRVKFLQFHENQRPAYYGTWRKQSTTITGRRPFAKTDILDYEVDSDDDWEEEEQGENIEAISDDDDKENETENDDYEVDNEFFVPHGHLSEDEVDDEETSKLSPESQKQKLKFLKDAFDVDIKTKTQKINPRAIGCIWYNVNGSNVDDAIDRHLRPLAVIVSSPIDIKKREEATAQKKKTPQTKEFPENLIPYLLKFVNGRIVNRKKLTEEFYDFIKTKNLEMPKIMIARKIAAVAQWARNEEATKKHFCWIVDGVVADKYNVKLTFPNDWESFKDTLDVT